MVALTVYRGARDPEPIAAVDLPWDQVADQLEKIANEPPGVPEGAHVEIQKKAMISWAPHALKPGTTRANESVDHVSLLVVDVDNGSTPEAIVAQLHAAGLASLVYESAKSTPEAPRFRVVCPVMQVISPEACRDTRCRFAEALGLAPDCGVLGAQDASKIFFSGRAHGTPPRRVWRTEGESVDVAALPSNSAEWVAKIGAATVSASAAPHLDALPPHDQGVVAALGPWTAHAGRKWSLCGALGGVMRRHAYTASQCEAAIRAWLPEGDPSVDVDAGVSWALGAWRVAPEDAAGHAELARVVGDRHAAVISAAVRAGSWGGRAQGLMLPLRDTTFRPVADASTDPLGVRVLCSVDYGPLAYECAGLMLAPSNGKISLIGGLPGSGKGPTADYLATCWALGLPVFGVWPVRQQPVLLLDVEGARLTQRRVRRMAVARGHDPAALDTHLEIRDVSRVQMLDDRTMYAIEAHPARIVILDSYTSAMLATDLDPFKNEYAQFARALAALDRLVLVVAHARKPAAGASGERPTLADIAGSGALGAMAQTALSVWRPDEDDWARIRVACMRAPESRFETFDLLFTDTDRDGLGVTMIAGEEIKRQVETASSADLTRAMNHVLAWLVQHPMPWSRKDIRAGVIVHGATKTGMLTDDLVAAVLARLLGAGLVTMHAGVGTKPATYEIRSVQETPGAVTLDVEGRVVAVPLEVGGFRRGT